jgi:hypothetical protein
MKPRTRYARSGAVNLAYQVFGDGSIDLVYVIGWVSNIDSVWDEPNYARFLQRQGTFARVIMFDSGAPACPTVSMSATSRPWNSAWMMSAPSSMPSVPSAPP